MTLLKTTEGGLPRRLVVRTARWLGVPRQDGSEQSRRDLRALLTSMAGIFYRVLDAGLKIMIVPAAMRLLGVEQYGVWLTANALLSLLMVSDFGIGSGVINAIGAALGQGDRPSVRSYLATAYAAFGVLALYVALAVAALSHSSLLPKWLGLGGKPQLIAESRQLFLIMGLMISTAAFLNVVNFFASSLQEGYLGHCAQIAASVTALLVILNLHTHSMSDFALATTLPIIAAYLALSIYLYGFRHRALLPDWAHINLSSFRVIWRDGSRLLIAQIADTLVAFMSNVLVASQLGASHVPEVSVSMQVMMIVNFVACMFILPLWPAYVEAGQRRDCTWIRAAFRRGALRSMGCVVISTLCYSLLYRTFIHHWSAALPIPPLRFVVALSIWFLLYVWNKNPMVLLNALGQASVRAWVAPLAAITFIGSAWFLLPRIGILAIPVAGCLCSFLEACITTSRALALLSGDEFHDSVATEVTLAF